MRFAPHTVICFVLVLGACASLPSGEHFDPGASVVLRSEVTTQGPEFGVGTKTRNKFLPAAPVADGFARAKREAAVKDARVDHRAVIADALSAEILDTYSRDALSVQAQRFGLPAVQDNGDMVVDLRTESFGVRFVDKKGAHAYTVAMYEIRDGRTNAMLRRGLHRFEVPFAKLLLRVVPEERVTWKSGRFAYIDVLGQLEADEALAFYRELFRMSAADLFEAQVRPLLKP